MRILIASDHYPPFVGGVQRQTRALARELTARGHDVCVATVWQDDLPALETRDGFAVHRLRQLRTLPRLASAPKRRHQPPYPDPVTALALRRLVRRFRPDLVHASGWFSYAAAAALIGTRIPLVASAREYGFSCANASMLHHGRPCSGPAPAKCLECSVDYHGAGKGVVAFAGVHASKPLLRRKAATIHTISRYIGDIVRRDFARELPQVLIPSFSVPPPPEVDEDLLAGLPAEPFVLFVGALRKVKGVEALLAAYARLERAPPLVLLGTFESDTPPLPDGVHAPGPASHATVLAAWDRSLFGVMPSLWPEPFGSVIHEGMSRGKAVIGTTPGGHADMIEDGESGLLVPAGDVGALAAAMRRLVDDPAFREGLGRRARIRARRFEAEVVVPQFERLYEATPV